MVQKTPPSPPTTPTLRYDLMVEEALRSVVKKALVNVEKNGLQGDHHFFVTFSTLHPAVKIPTYLKEEYDTEMTIVLQYEFYDLKVEDDRFFVTLSFDDIHERLEIPYLAVTTFADPSVNFALQFHPIGEAEADESSDEAEEIAMKLLKGQNNAAPGEMGQVIALDAFRKQKAKAASPTKPTK